MHQPTIDEVLLAVQVLGTASAPEIARYIDPDCINPALLARQVHLLALNDDRLMVGREGIGVRQQ